jgi:rhodanese-related sulfurtransferase
MVVDFLRTAGFDNAVNLDGGIDAWACEVDQSMRRYRYRAPKGKLRPCR